MKLLKFYIKNERKSYLNLKSAELLMFNSIWFEIQNERWKVNYRCLNNVSTADSCATQVTVYLAVLLAIAKQVWERADWKKCSYAAEATNVVQFSRNVALIYNIDQISFSFRLLVWILRFCTADLLVRSLKFC